MDRERGFIVIHRRIRSSPLWRSLSAEQRSVLVSLLLLANWKPGAILVGETWHEVKRGETAKSLETIAEDAAVSVKVVRTTLSKLFADDRPAGGRGPFISERWVGTESGRPKRVLTIVNYDEYQDVESDVGTTSGSVAGTTGARHGHDRGTTGAPIEPREPGEPRNQTAPRAAVSRLPSLSTHLEGQCPNLAEFLKRASFGVNVGKSAAPWGRADALVSTLSVDAALAAAEEAAPRSRGFPDAVPILFLESVLTDAVRGRGPARRLSGPVEGWDPKPGPPVLQHPLDELEQEGAP